VTDDRGEPALIGLDERAVLAGWLDHHRTVLLRKVDGLTDAQLLTPSVPPSSLNLLGLLRHMADNEVWWFQAVLGGVDVPDGEWPSAGPTGEPAGDSAAGADRAGDGDPHADLHPPATENLARIRPLFLDACARSRAVFAGLGSLDDEGDLRGTPVSARWVASHVVEEYARHNGHADLLREVLDGATG